MSLYKKIFLWTFIFFGSPVIAIAYTQSTIIIGSDAAPPLSTDQQTGMLDIVVKKAFSVIGMTAEITLLPSERSLLNANKGINDGDLVRIDGLSNRYPNLIKVPETTCDFDFVAFSKSADIKIAGWDSLRNYSVGIITGWKILEDNVHASPLTKVENPSLLFGLLEKNRADLVIYNRLEGYGVIKKEKLKGIIVLEPPLKSKKMFLYLNKKHAGIVSKLAEAIRKMKQDGTYQKIVNKALEPYVP